MSYKIKMVYIYKVKVEGWAEKGKLGLKFCVKILSSTKLRSNCSKARLKNIETLKHMGVCNCKR